MEDRFLKKPQRKGTETSAFGTPGRINHDSSKFYDSRLYEGLETEKKVDYIENQINPLFLNKNFCKSSVKMDELPDNSIHLMVTSPPYNVGKVYDRNLSLSEYRLLLKAVFSEVYRVLVPGGRACVNVANLGRKPYIPLHSYIIEDMLDIGYLMRGEIIWNKASRIPIIIIGNTPVTQSYYEKVDYLKKSGVVQGFWSVNPQPLDNNGENIKNTPHLGFYRFDNFNDLKDYAINLLKEERRFFSSMQSKKSLGRIIEIANRENALEEKAQRFLDLIRNS